MEKSVVTSGLVKPQFSGGSMALAEKGDLERYLGLEPAPELVLLRARLGLTVIDLAGGVEQPNAAQVATRLVHEAGGDRGRVGVFAAVLRSTICVQAGDHVGC